MDNESKSVNVNDSDTVNGLDGCDSADSEIVRDENGRWLPGKNPRHVGRGNPIATRMKKMRSAVLRAHTPEDAAQAVRSLLAMATDESNSGRDRIAAYKVWLDYVVGKPGDMDKARDQGGNHYTFIFSDSTPEQRQALRQVENLARGTRPAE